MPRPGVRFELNSEAQVCQCSLLAQSAPSNERITACTTLQLSPTCRSSNIDLHHQRPHPPSQSVGPCRTPAKMRFQRTTLALSTARRCTAPQSGSSRQTPSACPKGQQAVSVSTASNPLFQSVEYAPHTGAGLCSKGYNDSTSNAAMLQLNSRNQRGTRSTLRKTLPKPAQTHTLGRLTSANTAAMTITL